MPPAYLIHCGLRSAPRGATALLYRWEGKLGRAVTGGQGLERTLELLLAASYL